MFEELRNDPLFKICWLFDYESFAVIAPVKNCDLPGSVDNLNVNGNEWFILNNYVFHCGHVRIAACHLMFALMGGAARHWH